MRLLFAYEPLADVHGDPTEPRAKPLGRAQAIQAEHGLEGGFLHGIVDQGEAWENATTDAECHSSVAIEEHPEGQSVAQTSRFDEFGVREVYEHEPTMDSAKM